MVMPESFTSSGSKFGGDATSGNGDTALYAAPNYFGDFNISKPFWLAEPNNTNYLIAGAALVAVGFLVWKLKK